MNFPRFIFTVFFIALLAGTASENTFARNNCSKVKCFKHNIQLQLSDSLGYPVPGTEFWITLEILKMGPLVTIQIPLINFQTGQRANAPGEATPPFLEGGYLYTSKGFLPEKLRPSQLVPHSIVAASNNGLSPVFSFDQAPDTLPLPPAGYIVQVTNAGALVIQSAGTFGNIIAPGPQILMPTTISYFVNRKQKLCKNKILSRGFTNTTEFTSSAADNGFRDSHVNDAFDGVAAWAWTDNSMVEDKTNGIMNVMVAIGHTNKKGKLKVADPIQLTNLEPGVMAWDTAVAINRTNKDNIIVSYGHVNNNTGENLLYRAVSFDGGKTWPENGPLNVQPLDGFTDARGVSSDKFGNIWYNSTTFEQLYSPPIFYVSTDQGVTFQQVFVAPDPGAPNRNYDYPQFCFGVDGNGNYGLHFQCTLINSLFPQNQTPTVGFIPINGLGSFGAPQFTELTGFQNSAVESNLTASSNGNVWFQGIPNYRAAYTYVSPVDILFKAGGPIDENYAGAWHSIIFNDDAFQNNTPTTLSQPVKGYIAHSTQSIIYDEARQALYAIVAAQEPDYSQNMRIYFSISRDNGQTWSNPIDISSSNFANRGYQSMALDEITGDLLFGWYDGRNDPTFKSVEYFAGILPAKALDRLVSELPLSNPHYTVPSAA